jgi:hypothetical protein
VAALDTPFLYAAVFAFRKRFGLKMGEEIDYYASQKTEIPNLSNE